MLPYSIVAAQSQTSLDALHTLTGVNLPLFAKMYRIAAAHRQRRSYVAGINDEALLDTVRFADELEVELHDEKRRLDALVLGKLDSRGIRANAPAKPEMQTHRYLHEAFRTSSLLQIRGFVLCEPPSSLRMRLLVRQSLSLLEAMAEQNLPGFCSIHWVLFITALCCIPGHHDSQLDDRQRINKLYDSFE